LRFRYQTRLRIELFSYLAIKRADAILSHSDPLAYRKNSRPRDTFLPVSGTPQIFVQHGMLQSGVNWPYGELGIRWYSKLLLWWDEYDSIESSFIKDDISTRVKKVGFIKKAYASARPLPESMKAFWAKFHQRLLVCTNFGDHLARSGKGDQLEFYDICDHFCARNPEILLVLRPHRGRPQPEFKTAEQTLLDKHSNLVIMDRYEGEFAYSTIHDSLGICDGVVSHVSSSILDAIYSDIPVAVLQNRWPKLNSLPNVTDLDSLEAFSRSVPEIDPKNNDVYRIYGAVDENIDRAAGEVEDFLINRCE